MTTLSPLPNPTEMATPSPTREPETTKSNEAHFWFCVVEATDSHGKLDYKKLAEMAGYKNWNSAKAVFFGKRKQMRALWGVKSEDRVKSEVRVKNEREKVDAGVKKRSRKRNRAVNGGEEKGGNGYEEEEAE